MMGDDVENKQDITIGWNEKVVEIEELIKRAGEIIEEDTQCGELIWRKY